MRRCILISNAMSRAFIKEDVDPPERSGRVRSASGLPPGAVNYITAHGATRLEKNLAKLRSAGGGESQRIGELEGLLASLSVVEPPEEPGQEVGFGARVTVRSADGEMKSYRIVGVEELDLYPEAVSWISPIGRALLAAETGQQISLPEIGPIRIVKVEYPRD
jgi:transcription elongation factor GreB